MTAFACSPNDRREVQLKTLQALFDMGSRPTYGYMPSTEMYRHFNYSESFEQKISSLCREIEEQFDVAFLMEFSTRNIVVL